MSDAATTNRILSRRWLWVAGTAAGLLGLTSCKKEPAPAPAPPAPVTAPASAPTPSPALAAPAPKPMPPNTGAPPEHRGPPLGLGQRLAEEARSRPSGTPRAEAVLDAIEKSGIAIGKRQQYLAVVVGAKYCLGGNTPSRLAVSVCEYGSAEGAARGRELAMARFKAVEKVIHVNAKTTLTLSRMGALPEAEGEAKRIGELFATLKN